jgi:hypothetical protein
MVVVTATVPEVPLSRLKRQVNDELVAHTRFTPAAPLLDAQLHRARPDCFESKDMRLGSAARSVCLIVVPGGRGESMIGLILPVHARR